MSYRSIRKNDLPARRAARGPARRRRPWVVGQFDIVFLWDHDPAGMEIRGINDLFHALDISRLHLSSTVGAFHCSSSFVRGFLPLSSCIVPYFAKIATKAA